jgi:hypothetical protein
MMNANMIAPHCLIERHGSASRFQDIFVDPRKWFRRRSELFRRFNRAPGRWRWEPIIRALLCSGGSAPRGDRNELLHRSPPAPPALS